MRKSLGAFVAAALLAVVVFALATPTWPSSRALPEVP